ncbi:DUF2325 domain-containing protein [Sporomusa aerivorans]|uniref:DUF2325 domain-containing protein n=1 Tax=Sporomusa aerivorans TaxID=204936 RepID=UPI00352A316C
MTALVIGADYLGAIEQKMRARGITEIAHIKGRNPGEIKKVNIPKAAAFVLVFTDYVNHNIAKVVKDHAKARSVPLVYAKRSWSAVEHKLAGLGL